MSVKFFNTTAGSPPYRSLFSNVAIVPPNTSMAYISTQWAADPKTGELMEDVADDYGKQAKIIWENIVAILKELGVSLKDVVHKTVSFKQEVSILREVEFR
jgi:enamine deaminase RidA (YjgF/YER057c/UK114 family)